MSGFKAELAGPTGASVGRAQRVTQTWLADQLRVSVRTVGRWAAGEVPQGFPLRCLRIGRGGRLYLSSEEQSAIRRWRFHVNMRR